MLTAAINRMHLIAMRLRRIKGIGKVSRAQSNSIQKSKHRRCDHRLTNLRSCYQSRDIWLTGSACAPRRRQTITWRWVYHNLTDHSLKKMGRGCWSLWLLLQLLGPIMLVINQAGPSPIDKIIHIGHLLESMNRAGAINVAIEQAQDDGLLRGYNFRYNTLDFVSFSTE